MASSSLRPLHLGELLDRSVRLWRAHLWPLARTMIPFVLFGQLLLMLADALVIQDLEALLDSGDVGRIVGGLSLLMGLFLVNACSVWFGQLLVARELLPRVTGTPVRTQGGGRLALRGSLQLVLLMTVFMLGSTAILVPTVLLLAPIGMMARDSGFSAPIVALVLTMGVGFLIWFGFMLWWMLRISMAVPVIAGEPAGVWAVFRRGGALLRGRVAPGILGRSAVRAAIIFTVVSALGTIAQFVATLPRLALEAVFKGGDAQAHIPWLWRIPAEVLVAGGQALFGPLVVAGCVLFYVDQRVRREGLDLELALERTP